MRLPSHLRLSRCGVYQFRLVLPSALARLVGQGEIRRSLGTKSPERARLCAYALSAKILPVVNILKRAMSMDPNSIDPETVRRLIVENLVIENGVIRASRLETSPDPETARREMQALGALAKATERPAEGPGFEHAAREQEILRAASVTPVSVARPKTIGEAVKGFLLFKKHLAPSTVSLYGRRLGVFTALAGGPRRLLHLLTEPECVEIAEALNVLPAHANERDVLPAAETLANASGEGRTVGSGTIGDHLTLFGAFMDWAIRSKHHPGPNPFREVAKPKGGTATGGADSFTRSELEKIFNPEALAAMSRPHRFWGPLLGLFTGARSNELAQLRLCDFVEEGGLRCIRITHDEAGGTRTKNADSERLLPLHPTLWAIGLADYLEDVRIVGGERLFPNLPADGNGKREKYLSRDFNEVHLKGVGVWVPRRKVFHSFRDTATEAMTDADVKDFFIESWLGHTTKGITSQHYRKKAPPAKLADGCLPSLGFEFLNLAAVRYEKGRWNEWMKKNLCP